MRTQQRIHPDNLILIKRDMSNPNNFKGIPSAFASLNEVSVEFQVGGQSPYSFTLWDAEVYDDGTVVIEGNVEFRVNPKGEVFPYGETTKEGLGVDWFNGRVAVKSILKQEAISDIEGLTLAAKAKEATNKKIRHWFDGTIKLYLIHTTSGVMRGHYTQFEGLFAGPGVGLILTDDTENFTHNCVAAPAPAASASVEVDAVEEADIAVPQGVQVASLSSNSAPTLRKKKRTFKG